MARYFVDLHIHIGRTASGKPVKITGSKLLTIENILYEATHNKGMDMIGVIDCQVPEVISELEILRDKGKVIEVDGGGLRFENVTLILGAEIEIYDEGSQGPYHVLAYMPTLEQMKSFSTWLSKRMKNVTLSTQRLYESGRNLQLKVKELGGVFIPAHVFTPFKSLYGVGVKHSLTEVLDEHSIDAIELGLSANTEMADQIEELHSYTFLSNSDAHSLGKIAREYQVIEMESASFEELKLALAERQGRMVVTNFGLDPKLGKYHETTCEKCFRKMEKGVDVCSKCGHHRFIKGVSNRLTELKNSNKIYHRRPPYIHQVPLEFIPKLGPKTLEKLKDHFKTEMNILHEVPEEELLKVVPESIVEKIIQARNGTLTFTAGGGGRYGKVSPLV